MGLKSSVAFIKGFCGVCLGWRTTKCTLTNITFEYILGWRLGALRVGLPHMALFFFILFVDLLVNVPLFNCCEIDDTCLPKI